MAVKKTSFFGIVVLCSVVVSFGCASGEVGDLCVKSTGAACMCQGNIVGHKTCANGSEVCDCRATGAGGSTAVAGPDMSLDGKTRVAKTATGGRKATATGGRKTTAAGGAKTRAAGGTYWGTGRGGSKANTGFAGTNAADIIRTAGKGPNIPAITEMCPDFRNGSIIFMGVGGIQLAVGPKAAGPTAPMLFYWHGTGSTSGEFAMMDGAVTNGITSQGGIIVSFQGLSGSGDASCSGTFIFDTGSFLITDQLYACAVKNYNVDPRRVFVAGCSAGGLFSACMGAYRSSYVAAVAPNSGGFVFPQPFDSDHTPSLMTRHGSVDMVGVNFATTSKTADDAYKNRGAFVINCNHGGTHCGGSVLSAQVWEFFQAHPFGVNPEPWQNGLPAGFGMGCTIY